MRVDEAQSRRRAPMTEQARFDVTKRKRLPQQRIVVEIDLTDREISSPRATRRRVCASAPGQGFGASWSWADSSISQA